MFEDTYWAAREVAARLARLDASTEREKEMLRRSQQQIELSLKLLGTEPLMLGLHPKQQ
ncbi:hypothetical protein Q3C01_35545 [Bradyrhizobium sp. UFLA05-109]